MRLPAVAIAVAFAAGIALGLCPPLSNFLSSRHFLFTVLAVAVVILAAGFASLRIHSLLAGWFSLAAWLVLGIAGAAISHQPDPPNYVLRLVELGTIDLHTPLRWQGTLRDEPTDLPWGTSLDLQLTSVDYEQQSLPITGGLRVTYSPVGAQHAAPHFGTDPQLLPAPALSAALQPLHSGDQLSITTQARLPQFFRDEGAFDRRAYLRQQGVDLTASLRAPELLEIVATAPPSAKNQLARVRHRLREELSTLLPGAPDEAAVLRAMLLGDRSFLDRSESVNFQKTGVFHVLVVAGLHVGAFAAFLFWLAHKFRLSRVWTSLAIVLCVLAYVAVVEQRPPVLRAALMTLLVVLALLFFRRVELLNSVAIAALLLLVASPSLLTDSSFQLSFLAMFSIAAIAVPWLENSLEPYTRGVPGWRDVTRDVSHQPKIAQFRIDLRSAASWLESRLPSVLTPRITNFAARGLSLCFRVAEMLILTVILQVGMLPMLARDFHRVTLSGPFANLLAVPLTGILVPLGFVTLIAGWMIPKLGLLLAFPLRWLTTVLLHATAWIAHFPRWSYRIPALPLWLLLWFFLAALLLSVSLRFSSSASSWLKRAAFLFVITAAVLIAVRPSAPTFDRGWLELNILDVGQGDSLFLVSPAGHTILVDAAGPFTQPFGGGQAHGSDPGEDAVSPYLWSRGFQRIDVVALTHAHQDHLGGLFAILENFKVNTLWIGREVASREQQQLEALAAAKGIGVVHERRGAHLDWDGAQLAFLWPQIVPEEIASTVKNDDSLVFRIQYRQRSFLLPGDTEKSSEHAILSETTPEELQADILKVGHHGSKNSTTPEFLDAVQPKLAVISAGEENPYGHPSPALLDRLQQAGVPVLRTDENGAIHIATDGTNLRVSCFVACPQIQSQLILSDAQPPNNHQGDQQQ